MTSNGFIASRDLSAEDFAKFAEQHKRAHLHNRHLLNKYRREIVEREQMIGDLLRRINFLKMDMLHHEIEVPE
ncbi:hypothetical protein EVC03_084 [Rhizobium phage RHph_Y5A]|nr:hypothetical protein EVC03_084 [Rhizobium phage RHph_Y5A]QIG75526.1 hypothetical protein EVC18_084 [Rhizobium phage RHph_Y2_4]